MEFVAARIILIKNQKVLLVREFGKDYFGFPGGGVDRCETLEQALRLEIKEELGVEIINYSNYKVYTNDWWDEGSACTDHLFLGEVKGTPAPTGEVEELAWLDSSYKNHGYKLHPLFKKDVIADLKKDRFIK